MTLAELNGCTKEEFVEALDGIFEQSPWVAERAWRRMPFASFDDLSTRLIQEVQSAAPDEQLALLNAQHDPATEPNADRSMRAQYDEYRKKFGFPFLFAVKDGERTATAEALKRRLKSPPEQEFQVALGHAFRIARFRLEELVR